MSQGRIECEDFYPVLTLLREDITRVAVDQAAGEVDLWEKTLRDTDDRKLVRIADNLAALRIELERDDIDAVSVGGLTRTLAEQVRDVAAPGTARTPPPPSRLCSRSWRICWSPTVTGARSPVRVSGPG